MDDVLAMDAMQEARDSVCDDGAESEAWWQNTKPCPRCGAPMRTNLDYVANAAGNDYLPGGDLDLFRLMHVLRGGDAGCRLNGLTKTVCPRSLPATAYAAAES